MSRKIRGIGKVRAWTSAVVAGVLVASTPAVVSAPVAAAQSEVIANPSGSADAIGDGIRSSLGLIANGSAFNSDAPTLAPLSAGSASLSAAPDAGGGGSATIPALVGATFLMSLIPVGSLANGGQLTALSLGADTLTEAAGSFTGGGYPAPQPNPEITDTRLVSREVQEDHQGPGRLEHWTVTSAKMQREVVLEVFLPSEDKGPAPVLYLLEGVDTILPTPFRTRTNVAQRVEDENVIAVAPSGAPGANWAEWIEDDPRLGRNKWDTFITEEFPSIIGAESDIELNGKSGVLGLSMGAGSALRIAANNPGHFAAAGGVSGCYNATDDLGYETIRLNVETRGGNLDNMWGPRGSELWQQNHLPANADKLAGTHVFMSAATGAFGAEDIQRYGAEPGVLFSGYILEAGARECTNQMSRALNRAGVEHDTFFMPTGIHNWTAFGPGMNAAFDSMIPVLK